MSARILTLLAAYLLGSIPTGYLLVRFFRKEDIRAVGSGNIGATNVVRSGAKGLGVITLLIDLLKGFAAVELARYLDPGTPGHPSRLMLIAAAFAVFAHIFPVWLGFRGGKGVATALGVFLALFWQVALAAVGVFVVIVAITRIVSLASILAAATLPVFALLLQPDRSVTFLASVICIPALVIAKHHANIQRLMAGTENRFGSKKTAPNVSMNDKQASA